MRNDYTDYIQHGFGHKYVAKAKTASGTKYFYSQAEYDAFLHGRPAGIHQTPTRGVSGALYSVKKKATDAVTNLKNKAALNKHIMDNKIELAKYKAGKAANAVKGTIGSATNSVINGRPAGIHQTPTRGSAGAAYTVKRSVGNAAKSVAATVGSTPVTSKKNGPQAPASVMANHKKNQMALRYNAAADKVKGAVNSAKTSINNATTKVKNRVALEKHVLGNKINALEFKVSKKVDGLVAKNKKISAELAGKMKKSVENLRRKIIGSGVDDETMNMMNDKLDKILKEIEANKTAKNTGSHPAFNQGIVTYPNYRPSKSSTPTNNQGYIPKNLEKEYKKKYKLK